MQDITERAEGSMEQHQLGHGLPRSQERGTQGIARVYIQVAERRLHHALQSSIAASPQVSLVNSAYFESDTQPLQTVKTTDPVQHPVDILTSFLPHLLRQ
jgi:hypothetical protein